MGQPRILLEQGDITKQETDVIVNAANSQLVHAGGVARAIADAAGPKLVEASQAKPKVPTGDVTTTTGGDLRAKYVIHAVGPIWEGGENNERDLLASCVIKSLQEAERLGARSIAFPAISTGIYGYPIQQAARVMLKTAREYRGEGLRQIKFVLFSQKDFDVFKNELLTLQKEK